MMTMATATVMVAGMVTMASGGVRYVDRPDGQVAYEVFGTQGPYVVAVPGLGDLRQQYRFVVEPLVAAGMRVVLMDLRGLGDSTARFASYGPRETGEDVVALVDTLTDARVFILGNSMAAASAVWAAAERPGRVAGLALLGPFVRDLPVPAYKKLMLDVALARPWGPMVWRKYYGSLYPNRQPADFDAHLAAQSRNLAQPGRYEAALAMTRASKAACERRLQDVKAPTLIIMGRNDPDFDDPEVEARWAATALRGTVLMVEGAGHYPHADSPDVVVPALLDFTRSILHGPSGTEA